MLYLKRRPKKEANKNILCSAKQSYETNLTTRKNYKEQM
jgi:hypothetical protein